MNKLQRTWFVGIILLVIVAWVLTALFNEDYTWFEGKWFLFALIFFTTIGVGSYIADRRKKKNLK